MQNLESIFSYHAPQGDQIERYQKIREAGLAFAKMLVENTPPSADQSAALRRIREAVWTANASIALQ
jgi:hypothetical protein